MLAFLLGRAGTVEDFRRGLWSKIAYCARYGHQQIPVLKAMQLEELDRFADSLEQLIKSEGEGGSFQNYAATGG